MISHKSVLYNLFVLTIIYIQTSTAQVIFRDLPNYKINSSDQLLFDISSTRNIIPLNGNWKVYAADDEEK